MKKSLLYQKTALQFFSILCVMLFSTLSWGQVQTLGSFPYMDGGFEGQTAATIGGTLSTSAWTLQTTNSVVAKSLINDATNSRSGRFYANWTPDAINKRLQTPTTATALNAPQATVEYTVQYYYKGTTDPTSSIQGGIYATSSDGKTSAATNTYSSGVWTKAVASVTPTVAPTASANFAAIRNFPASTNYSFDDFVIYAGAVDIVAPSQVTAQAVASTTVSWNATASTDFVGYMVVRYATNPNADNNPNVNGIYAIGNTITNGTASLSGTVVYIGTNDFFTDASAGAAAGSNYYKIYAVDKAFNYSTGVVATSVGSTTPTIASTVSSLSGFVYNPGNGPSSVQSTVISGTNLGTGASIIASLPTYYEISKDNFVTAAATAALDLGSGATLSVRLKAGLTSGTYPENIVLSSTGATNVSILCSGSVTASEPTSQVTNLTFASNPSNGFTVNWTSASGGGTNHLVVIKAATDITSNPTDATTYTAASGGFTTGTGLGGGYVVYNGTGNSVNVTGLSKGIRYHVRIYDFNGSTAGTENYLVTAPASSYQTTVPGEISSNGTGGGDWLATGTWAEGVVPTQGDNVNIAENDIITFSNTAKCYNLTIPTTAKVWAPTANTLQIYGTSLVCNGTYGDISPTESLLSTEFGENLTISGSGSFYSLKLKPVSNLSNIGVTFDAATQEITTATGTAVLSVNGTSDNITYTINSGKTLKVYSNWTIGSSTSANGGASTIINVRGTCIINGAFATPVTSGKTCTVNVDGTLTGGTSFSPFSYSSGGVTTVNLNGTFTVGNLNITPVTAIVAPVINVGSSGAITVNRIADFSNTTIQGFVGNSPTTNGGTFTLATAGTIKLANASGLEPISGPIRTTNRNFSTGANYSYVGGINQVSGTDLPATVNNLTIATTNSATVTLTNATNLTNKLTVTSGSLITDGKLTLKSTECCTASVAEVLSTVTTPISGLVTVERYISAKRAWRALTAPVIRANTNSIFTNWQNGGTSGTSTGTGVEIWSNLSNLTTVTSNAGGGSSMLSYSSLGDSWTPITDTSAAGSLFSASINNPFMVFVTGPYASTNIPSGATATTLKATGSLIIGTKTYPTTGSQYTFIGNPYASPLSLTAMLGDADNSTNFSNGIWIWDSNGNTSVGSYNYFDKTAGAYSYNASSTPAATPILPTAEIQSGQAFFVQSSTATGASFSIKEAHKGTSVINTVLRDAAPAQLLRVGLYKQINTEWSGRDGAMTVIFADANANQTPNKMANGTENVAFTKNGLLFASNHHLPLVASDVLNVKVWNTTAGANYKLKINTEQFNATNLNATLEDLFTNSRTPLTLDGSAVEYPFTVTTEAASSGNRFRIVFENTALGIVNPKATGISILPNPITGDTFQVNLGTIGTGNYSYSICNALGQEVEKGSINNVAQNTNSVVKFKNNTAAGMYIMKVTGTDNTVFTAKIIKK